MTYSCDCDTPLADEAGAVAHLTATHHRVVASGDDGTYQVVLEVLAQRAGTSDVGTFEAAFFAHQES